MSLINDFVGVLMVLDLLFVLNLRSSRQRLALWGNPAVCCSVAQLKLVGDFKHAALALLNMEAPNVYPG